MLKELYPRGHNRYASLPVLGPILDGFATWMLAQGYSNWSLRVYFRTMFRLDRSLTAQGVRELSEVTPKLFEECWSALRDRKLASGVHCLHQYLRAMNLTPPPRPAPLSKTEELLTAYRAHLEDVRGCSFNTVRNHLATGSEFLNHLNYETDPSQLAQVTPSVVEAFVRKLGVRLDRGSLQHAIAHLRGLLRFLTTTGAVRPGLENEIDTPRLYRFEQLPRALPWESVHTFLESIDRSTSIGLRDYTMFFLIATYGLRPIEIISLTLDDVNWRQQRIRVPQPKTGASLLLPLTDVAGTALMEYLRGFDRRPPHRELFFRSRPPIGPLKKQAVGMRFKVWAIRGGLDGSASVHCLRHSYAVHLLRLGTPLKTIGDLLGHRSLESTSAYLRLATEDLREVALPVPSLRPITEGQEVKP